MKRIFLFAILFSLFTIAAKAQYNKVVAKDGSGDYTTVQASIDAAPTNSATAWVIYIKNGKYNEKVTIPLNKPNIQLIGERVADVVIYFNDFAGRTLTGGGTIGQNCATITINAADFVAVNISFINTFNFDSAVAAGVTGSQALAVFINNDRAAFKNCRFIGMQDTLLTKGTGTPRHYFYKCYIDGIVDFIYGNAVAIYDSCVIYAKSRLTAGNSYITAANTPIGQTYGYLFRDCKIPANTGTTLYFLGRPWQNSGGIVNAHNKVVFFNTAMSSSINPLGWTKWDATTDTTVITYAEFKSKNLDGTLTDISKRVGWSKQFTNADTVGYNIQNMFSGWNPCNVRADFCTSPTTEIAVSNFRGVKSGANANLLWNISWAMTGITYDLYKSTNNKVSFSVLSSRTSTNDTAINFNGTDVLPPAGASYFYFVKASKAGSITTYTDTIEISSIPTIVTTVSSLTNFLQGSTAPSGNQTYIVSGTNLLNNIVITAPANYEISLDATTWNVNPITLTQTAGTVANTTVYVRLNAPSAANYNGDIVHSTIGVATTHTKNVAVSGTTQSTPLLTFDVLQQWNLTTNNTDDATVRATGLVATIPTLKRLNVSNGTQVAAVPAYSTLYGQAFAPSNAGDGMWTTATGGSGSTLNRTLYEQFTIKPALNYSVRLDSFVALIGYYGSVSGTKIAVAYSKSNFTTDSASVTGGRDLSGTLPNTANGAFTTPIIVIATSNAGNTSPFAFALNAGNGVQLNAGDSLTIRIYFSCGSTSAGRYAVIKNVQAKGLVPVNLPVRITNYEASPTPPKEGLNNWTVLNKWTTASEINTTHFNIQKSIDGRSFETVGKVNAKGSGIYNFINELKTKDQLLKTLFYRLQAVDKDGSYQFSDIKQIHLNQLSNKLIYIYPNPATTIVSIDCKNAKQILILDYLGKTIKQFNNPAEHQTLNTKQLQKGIYMVKATMKNGAIETEKLVVE